MCLKNQKYRLFHKPKAVVFILSDIKIFKKINFFFEKLKFKNSFIFIQKKPDFLRVFVASFENYFCENKFFDFFFDFSEKSVKKSRQKNSKNLFSQK